MNYMRRFGGFWIDFIVGDAWEVAVGVAVSLAVAALVARRVSDGAWLGFVLLGAILAVSSLALARATSERDD